jgi:plasmid stability protein
MPSLLIKNIPAQLHTQLKQRATAHRRSLNSETIHVLEQAIGASESAPAISDPLSDEALAAQPPEIAQRLRALKQLRESLAARSVDFEEWKKSARDSRR